MQNTGHGFLLLPMKFTVYEHTSYLQNDRNF